MAEDWNWELADQGSFSSSILLTTVFFNCKMGDNIYMPTRGVERLLVRSCSWMEGLQKCKVLSQGKMQNQVVISTWNSVTGTLQALELNALPCKLFHGKYRPLSPPLICTMNMSSKKPRGAG